MTKISAIVTSALLAYAASTAEGFTPSSLMGSYSSSMTSKSSSSSSSSLHVSVVSSILKDEATKRFTDVFETESPESAGLTEVTKNKSSSDPSEFNANGQHYKKKRNRRKHNFSATKKFRHEQPDTDFYTLHSSAVSHLEKDMPMNDIT